MISGLGKRDPNRYWRKNLYFQWFELFFSEKSIISRHVAKDYLFQFWILYFSPRKTKSENLDTARLSKKMKLAL